MASQSTIILSFVLHLFLSCTFCSASTISPADSGKVSLKLYYESLCPDSADFIVNYLVEIFHDDDLLSIVDLYLSPWGNAKLRANDTFNCQHGPSECLLNTVEACAIHVWPELKEHFPFIYCIESLVYERKYSQWDSCFEKLGLDPKPIADCYKSGFGKELELQYAVETSALQPPHKYVPWVVVDGQPLYEDYENVVSYICKAYKGSAAPKACTRLSHYIIQSRKESKATYSSFKEKTISTLSEQVRSSM